MKEIDVMMMIKEIHQKVFQMHHKKMDKCDLNFGLIILATRIQNNPDASQKELAQQMRVTQGAFSTAVKKLISHEIIEQIPLESDTRYNRLLITEKGRDIIKYYKDFMVKRYRDMFNDFLDGDLDKLYDMLTKLNNNIDNISKDAELSINNKEGIY